MTNAQECAYSAACSMAAHYQGIADECERYGEVEAAEKFAWKADAERERATKLIQQDAREVATRATMRNWGKAESASMSYDGRPGL